MRDAAFQLDDIDLEEVDNIAFEFGGRLLAGETIATSSVGAEAVSGVDATAAAMVQGLPVVVGEDVLQKVIGKVLGVTYKLRCRAVLSSGRVCVSAALLRVVRQ